MSHMTEIELKAGLRTFSTMTDTRCLALDLLLMPQRSITFTGDKVKTMIESQLWKDRVMGIDRDIIEKMVYATLELYGDQLEERDLQLTITHQC